MVRGLVIVKITGSAGRRPYLCRTRVNSVGDPT